MGLFFRKMTTKRLEPSRFRVRLAPSAYVTDVVTVSQPPMNHLHTSP